MDPLHTIIAIGPLGIYLLVIGMLQLSRRPFVTTGGRDYAALAVGICGLVVAGPLELFMPDAPARQFGGFVWVLLLALYGLGCTLVILLSRPRIVIYNIRGDDLRPVLAAVVERLDPQARWAGECLILPQLNVQLHVETSGAMRIGELVAVGYRQSFQGWRRLERELAAALNESPSQGLTLYGAMLTFVGAGVLMTVAYWVINHHQVVAQGLREMLQR